MYTHASLPFPLPIPLGHQGVLSWAPCMIQLLLTCYLFYVILFMSISLSQFALFSAPPLPCVHESVLYICMSTPVLQIGSSEQLSPYTTLSLWIPYIYIYYIRYLFFSFWRRKTLSYFALYDRLWVHPHHYRWPSFIPFYGWVIFHCMYVPHLLYSFICQWTFRLLTCPGYCK